MSAPRWRAAAQGGVAGAIQGPVRLALEGGRTRALHGLGRLAVAALLAGLAAVDAVPAAAALAPGERVLVDDFEDVTKWSAQPSDGVKLTLRADEGVHGRSLRMDFAFAGGGYAIARRELSLDLPENYRFRFAVRGECLPNDLEFKLVDESGDNVWWCNRRHFHFPEHWDSLSTRKRQIEFAWGPRGGGDIRHVAAIEFAVTAGEGGTGSVWIDEMTLEPLPPADAPLPAVVASASSEGAGHAAGLAADGDSATLWASAPRDRRPWLALDLGIDREYGGLLIDWVPGRASSHYAIEVSSDGTVWRAAREVRGGGGGRDPIYLPESESRHIRLRALAPVGRGGIAVREVTVEPLSWSATPTRFFESLAQEAPRGDFPRALSGEMSYWTVIGLDGGYEEGLLDEDGRLETGKAMYSIEPFLHVDERLVTWADVKGASSLAEGDLPIPTVTLRTDSLDFSVTAFAIDAWPELDGPLRGVLRKGPGMIARYRAANRASRSARPTLYLALRPFQVNPPVQFLNTPGGFAPIHSLERSGAVVRVNRDRGVVSLTPPSGWGAVAFEGDLIGHLRAGDVPPAKVARDRQGFAAGVLAYVLEVPPGESREVDLFVPLRGAPFAPAAPVGVHEIDAAEDACRMRWRALDRDVTIELPDADVARTLRAQLRWILVNRDSAGIQPGSRAYERSWIRDGALTSSALLRLGHTEVVREFLEWFAAYQYPDGKVPCCVDWRGADPVPEHDSSGEFIFAVAEYFRYTNDRATIERLWPHVAAAAGYLDALRRERRGVEWRAAGKEAFFGLLPPSISHEGYSAKPMHSYWDDFFALRGFKDATWLAGALGRESDRGRLAAIRDTFQTDLAASIAAAMKLHAIDFVPGAADLGDFDATSTTIALDPAAAESILPKGALERTFERYWEFFRDRRDDVKPWENFTPYEIRNIGAFVRLGWRERANELLQFFMRHRRPPGWAQWSEVVWRDSQTPRFIGDLPHTWVGSDFVRSVLDMLAYVRESDEALVIGAGVPFAWMGAGGADHGSAVVVRSLPTPFGPLSYSMHAIASGESVEVRIEAGLRVPTGGIVVRAPSSQGFNIASVNGVMTALDGDGSVVVRTLPATVALHP